MEQIVGVAQLYFMPQPLLEIVQRLMAHPVVVTNMCTPMMSWIWQCWFILGNDFHQNKAKLKCDPYISTQLIIKAGNYHISLTWTKKKLKQIESLFFIISSEPKLFALAEACEN